MLYTLPIFQIKPNARIKLKQNARVVFQDSCINCYKVIMHKELPSSHTEQRRCFSFRCNSFTGVLISP